jgi:hypothetical protein
MRRHPGRCQACKWSVHTLLQTVFGEVHPNWASGWPCRVEDLSPTPTALALPQVYRALVAYRGHENFVRANTLPRCDFFIPPGNFGQGFLVEFDEEQHFTIPRGMTLTAIPTKLSVAFDLPRWLNLAISLKKRDNDPPYRDEQRAWYDLLRDVLPVQYGLGPTSRLLDRDVAYCSLNPNTPTDLANFLRLLNRP